VISQLLPGLRELRTPLAVGYVWFLTGWMTFASKIPDSKHATGIVAELYRLVGAVGRPATLAGLTFCAYLVGIFSVAVMNGLITLGNRLLSGRLKSIYAGRYSLNSTLHALATPILRRLSRRFVNDEEMRREVQGRIEEVLGHARDLGRTAPTTLTKESINDLVVSMMHSPFQCATILSSILDLGAYSRELQWEAQFISSDTPSEIVERADRLRAEGEFRFGLVVPLAALCAALAYREDVLFLALLCVPVWLTYLANASYDQARSVAIDAVATGRMEWPALDQVTSGPIRFRSKDDALTAVLVYDKA
jgi:hypothetical protein